MRQTNFTKRNLLQPSHRSKIQNVESEALIPKNKLRATPQGWTSFELKHQICKVHN